VRILAIDPGTARCGLAVSDPLGIIATPLEFLSVGDGADLAERLAAKAGELEAGTILVGHPLSMDGSSGPRARACAELADRIRGFTDAEVMLVDERLSTVEASNRLHEAGHTTRGQKGRIDSAAAAVLLQWWLDSRSAS